MISGDDFLSLQKLLRERAGMALTSDKLYLVGSRLSPVAQRFGLRSVIELMQALRLRPREDMIVAVIEAMVTHESLFFRDQAPFEHLAKIILPQLMTQRMAQRRLRFWSAACSSGQEAYSLAMVAEEVAPDWNVEIFGTDISETILSKAREGVYSAFEVRRGLSPERLARHFQEVGGQWRIKDRVRRMVQFRAHNLLENAAVLGVFDVVFCRNVLIYFDAPTKERALSVISRQLAGDGHLVLGGADSLIGLNTPFEGARGLYKLRAEAPRKAG